MSDFVSSFEQPEIALMCFLQVVISLVIMTHIQSQPQIVPKIERLPEPYKKLVHYLCRFFFSAVMLGIIFGATISGMAIILRETGELSREASLGQNSAGVWLSRIAGPFLLLYVLWMVLRILEYIRTVKALREQNEKLEEVIAHHEAL